MRTYALTEIRRPRRALALAAALVLLGTALPAAAVVYKWVDPQGRIHYSDLPPPPDGKLLSVDTSASHPNERAPTSTPAPRSTAPSGPPPGPATGPAATPEAMARLKQSVDSDVANARTDQCKQARDKYQTYVQSRRLYKEGPNKERIYLSDQELETERLQAKHDVDELCAGN
jgi:hypothetical protein